MKCLNKTSDFLDVFSDGVSSVHPLPYKSSTTTTRRVWGKDLTTWVSDWRHNCRFLNVDRGRLPKDVYPRRSGTSNTEEGHSSGIGYWLTILTRFYLEQRSSSVEFQSEKDSDRRTSREREGTGRGEHGNVREDSLWGSSFRTLKLKTVTLGVNSVNY